MGTGTEQDGGMIFETVATKALVVTGGFVLVLLGSTGVASYLVGAAQLPTQGDGLALLERVAPNFMLGALGMWLIYKAALQKADATSVAIKEYGASQQRAIERLGDRIETALGGTIDAHREAARSADKQLISEIREMIREERKK
jgi:hypothetical protein